MRNPNDRCGNCVYWRANEKRKIKYNTPVVLPQKWWQSRPGWTMETVETKNYYADCTFNPEWMQASENHYCGQFREDSFRTSKETVA